jgi:hypothetical protein
MGSLPPKYVVVPDVRFPPTLDFLKASPQPCITVRVKRKVDTLKGGASLHRSETALLDTPDSAFDLVLENYGDLDELQRLVLETFE